MLQADVLEGTEEWLLSAATSPCPHGPHVPFQPADFSPHSQRGQVGQGALEVKFIPISQTGTICRGAEPPCRSGPSRGTPSGPPASPKAAGQGCIHLPGRSGGEELDSWTFFHPPFLSCVPLGLRFPSCQAQGIWRARERQSPTAPLSQLWGSRNPTSGLREARPAAS